MKDLSRKPNRIDWFAVWIGMIFLSVGLCPALGLFTEAWPLALWLLCLSSPMVAIAIRVIYSAIAHDK